MIMFSCINPGEKSKQGAATQETNERKNFHSFLTSFSPPVHPWKPLEYLKYCINYTFGWDFAQGGQALSLGTWGTFCTSDTGVPFFFTIGSVPELFILVFIKVLSWYLQKLHVILQCHSATETLRFQRYSSFSKAWRYLLCSDSAHCKKLFQHGSSKKWKRTKPNTQTYRCCANN